MTARGRDDTVFYVGYASRMPGALARFVAPAVVILLLAVALLALVVPALHRAYDFGRSDFRDLREFDGLLLSKPVPHLLVLRPGHTGESAFSRYVLVGRGKSGPRIDVPALDGRPVRVLGSLIYRDAQTLISVRSAQEIESLGTVSSREPVPGQLLGTFTFRGEVIDSKCHFGTMRPGNTKVHRGCAVRCIAGGIPPMLLARDQNGNAVSLLLVAEDGAAVNDRVLGLVAEPVEITGEVVRMDDMLVLKANPDSYRRYGGGG